MAAPSHRRHDIALDILAGSQMIGIVQCGGTMDPMLDMCSSELGGKVITNPLLGGQISLFAGNAAHAV